MLQQICLDKYVFCSLLYDVEIVCSFGRCFHGPDYKSQFWIRRYVAINIIVPVAFSMTRVMPMMCHVNTIVFITRNNNLHIKYIFVISFFVSIFFLLWGYL